MVEVVNSLFTETILQKTGAVSYAVEEVLQELWSGYGQILRLRLEGGDYATLIAKLIVLPEKVTHPRGWNTRLSHQRKKRSYQVESSWYRHFNSRCGAWCRTPEFIAYVEKDEESLLLLEDLDDSGYPVRLSTVTLSEVALCLRWLAEFHALFVQENRSAPDQLWKIGTYWHLATRPDEWAALANSPLKSGASAIDEKLNQARFQTLVHGDAKLANFCFSQDSNKVSGLDFQYVGGGCGMKDVAYFLGSCLDEEIIATKEEELLNMYFDSLTAALIGRQSAVDPVAVIAEWRELYPYAWADFHRFLKGWCPSHWKLNGYSERMTAGVLKGLY